MKDNLFYGTLRELQRELKRLFPYSAEFVNSQKTHTWLRENFGNYAFPICVGENVWDLSSCERRYLDLFARLYFKTKEDMILVKLAGT